MKDEKILEEDLFEEFEEEEVGPSKLELALDKKFRFIERGSTLGNEIKAGVTAFLISMCVLFLNMQLLSTSGLLSISTSEVGYYTGFYFGAALLTMLATVAVGLVCNLPLIQSASLGLSTFFVSMIAGHEGLSYGNLLLITFVAAVIYLVIMLTAARKYFVDAIPAAVRKALPAALGVYILVLALEQIGLFSINGGIWTVGGGMIFSGDMTRYYLVCLLAAIITIAAVAVLKAIKYQSPVFTGLFIGLGAFYLLGVLMDFTNVLSAGRLFLIWDSHGSYNIGVATDNFSAYNFGELFRSGFDFTAFKAAGGSVIGVFLKGILVFLLLGACESTAALDATANLGDMECGDIKLRKALTVGAAANVIAPIFGAAPTAIHPGSAAASADGGKSGLVSLTAGVGYVISLFNWIFFALFATYFSVFSTYGHADFDRYAVAIFQLADGAMAVMGVLVVKKAVAAIDPKDVETLIAFAAVVLGTLITMNIAFGAAIGMIVLLVIRLVTVKENGITIPNVVMTALMALMLILAIAI